MALSNDQKVARLEQLLARVLDRKNAPRTRSTPAVMVAPAAAPAVPPSTEAVQTPPAQAPAAKATTAETPPVTATAVEKEAPTAVEPLPASSLPSTTSGLDIDVSPASIPAPPSNEVQALELPKQAPVPELTTAPVPAAPPIGPKRTTSGEFSIPISSASTRRPSQVPEPIDLKPEGSPDDSLIEHMPLAAMVPARAQGDLELGTPFTAPPSIPIEEKPVVSVPIEPVAPPATQAKETPAQTAVSESQTFEPKPLPKEAVVRSIPMVTPEATSFRSLLRRSLSLKVR